MRWCWVFFRLMTFLIDGFRQETNRKLMERIEDALVHGQYPLTQECDYNLWVFTEFLNTGAELSACLREESTPFGKKKKKKYCSHWRESSWLDMAMSLAQKAQKITVKSQLSPLSSHESCKWFVHQLRQEWVLPWNNANYSEHLRKKTLFFKKLFNTLMKKKTHYVFKKIQDWYIHASLFLENNTHDIWNVYLVPVYEIYNTLQSLLYLYLLP